MKTTSILTAILFLSVATQAQPPMAPPAQPPMAPPAQPGFQQRLQTIISRQDTTPAVAAKEPVNYLIRVEWKDAKKGMNTLQMVTGAGSFNLDTVSGTVKISDFDVPTTVKLEGTLTELSPEKGRLQLFLGRTLPYVTSSYAGPTGKSSASYSQLSVGLNSTFSVTFGKPLLIQSDDSGEVTILVKRL